MKRALHLLSFTSWGLFVTWLSLFVIARIDWSRFVAPRPAGRCWEIDHCDVPWFIELWFFVALFLPAAVHTFAGWRLGKNSIAPRKIIASLVALSAATLAFYVSARIVIGS